MDPELAGLFDRQDGVATSAQILQVVGRRQFGALLDSTAVERVWHGVYSRGAPDEAHRLRALDLRCGEVVATCLGTAARLYGFDTESADELHVLNPLGHQLRSADGLVVHRRDGAPLSMLNGRPTTAAPWTAVEVARALRRPRALATLDSALRSGHCDVRTLTAAIAAQSGRRGIVTVRHLLPLADGRAESPMESEARLVMIDGGLPHPVLQYEVIDARGKLRRLDFAWPELKVAAEYDSDEWHTGADALHRDREKVAAGPRLDCDPDRARRRPPPEAGTGQPDLASSWAGSGGVRVRKVPARAACRCTDTHARGSVCWPTSMAPFARCADPG